MSNHGNKYRIFVDGSSKGIVIGGGLVFVNSLDFLDVQSYYSCHFSASGFLSELFAVEKALEYIRQHSLHLKGEIEIVSDSEEIYRIFSGVSGERIPLSPHARYIEKLFLEWKRLVLESEQDNKRITESSLSIEATSERFSKTFRTTDPFFDQSDFWNGDQVQSENPPTIVIRHADTENQMYINLAHKLSRVYFEKDIPEFLFYKKHYFLKKEEPNHDKYFKSNRHKKRQDKNKNMENK